MNDIKKAFETHETVMNVITGEDHDCDNQFEEGVCNAPEHVRV